MKIIIGLIMWIRAQSTSGRTEIENFDGELSTRIKRTRDWFFVDLNWQV